MNIEALENYIADTTGCVSEPDDESADFACPCGANFSDRDLGVSVTLKRCALCYTAIRNELCGGESSAGGSVVSVPAADDSAVAKAGGLAGGEPSAGVGAEAEDESFLDTAAVSVLDADDAGAMAENVSFAAAIVAVSDSATAGAFSDDAAAGTLATGAMHDASDGLHRASPASSSPPSESALSMEEIEVAMAAAAADSFKCFNIVLNGKSELFSLYVDPIEAGTRKMFQRASWSTALLYGYSIFGGMMTPRGKTLITPSAFRDKNGNIYILMAIGQTLCNRPRYDGLVVAIEDDKASFVKNISGFVSECLLDFPFDGNLMDRIVTDFIVRNRMIYDSARGLPRDCKYPMKSDAELKKYMKSVVPADDMNGDSDITEKPRKETPKATPLPRETPVNVRRHVGRDALPRKRETKRKRVPSQPPTIQVELLSEKSIQVESDDHLAPPKRGRRGKVTPPKPFLNDPAPVMPLPALPAQTANPPSPHLHAVSSGVIPFTPSVPPAAPALPLPPEPALPLQLPLAPIMLPNLPCQNDHQQFVNAQFGNCYAMLSGLLYDNIVQNTKLDELQKREEKRQHEEARIAFQKQMMSMLGDFKR